MKEKILIDSSFEAEYGTVEIYLYDIYDRVVSSSVIEERSRATADKKYEIVADLYHGDIRFTSDWTHLEEVEIGEEDD